MTDKWFLEVEELHDSQPETLNMTINGPFQPPNNQ